MAKIPLRADSACDNVIPFPAETLLDGRIRYLRRMLAEHLGYIENCDPNSPCLEEAIKAKIAPGLAREYEADLNKALASRATLATDNVLRFNGVVYREMAGRA